MDDWICFRRGTERAIAETPESAQRLEACGWVRCTGAEHAAMWAEANVARRAELAREDARRQAQPSAVGSAPTPNAPASALTRPPVTTSMHGWGA